MAVARIVYAGDMAHEAYSIRSSRVVAEGRVGPGVVFVRGAKIERVDLGGDGETRHGVSGYPEIDVGDLVVMPGLVDTHVHVNEPGRTDWEGFVTAGRAAAAGGITTIVVMPLNCTPAATNVAALMGEAEAAAGKCLVDYGFWGGVVPGNVDELEPMWRAGALGFKAFMVESGVEDFGAVSHTDLEQAMPVLGRLGAVLLVHAEDQETIDRARPASRLDSQPRSYDAYLASRPAEAEVRAVEALVRIARRLGPLAPSIHIVHVASMAAAEVIGAAKAEGLRITAETCPHYLVGSWKRGWQIGEGQTQFKCAPPIRGQSVELWECLQDGVLDLIASDHSPCPPSMKMMQTGDFARAWGGISSLQLSLPVIWNEMRGTQYPESDDLSLTCQWIAEAPAALAGVGDRKGRIAAGFDADLVIFDPNAEWTVDARALQHRHKLTPYDGMTLRGVVKRTILRGRTIYDAAASNPFPLEPIGRWIKRDT